jgi:hypothetical protein
MRSSRIQPLHPTHDTGEFALTIVFYGLGAFITGFMLTTRVGDSNDGKIYPLKMKYPTPKDWRWRHQLLLSLCIACLGASHALVRSSNGGDKNYIATINISVFNSKTSSSFVAWLLAAFASGILNAFLASCEVMTLRACNMSGTVQDIFLGLGYALRSRSLRYMWRVRLLLCCFIAFYVGGISGSLVFRSSFGASAMLFPVIALTPFWLFGIGLLAFRYLKPAVYRSTVSNAGVIYDDVARGSVARLHGRASAAHFERAEPITRASFVRRISTIIKA